MATPNMWYVKKSKHRPSYGDIVILRLFWHNASRALADTKGVKPPRSGWKFGVRNLGH